MSTIFDDLAGAARTLAERGLVTGGGDISVRTADRVFVTAADVDLARCTVDDVVVTTLNGEIVSGTAQPTAELDLHLAVYAESAAHAVAHIHAPHTTAIACVPHRFPAMPVLHYQQMMLGGDIRIAPYAALGSPEQARAVHAALEGRQAALMAHHGAVAVGSDLSKAIDNAALLEWLAELLWRVSSIAPPHPMTDEQQHAAIEQIVRLKYGSIQENA